MRVFVGIPLPKTLQKKVGEWQERYQRMYSFDGIRWTQKKNLHITLLPPWEEEYVEEIIKKLQENPINMPSFAISFTKILFMPPNKSKYIWAKGETPEALLALREEIAQKLKRELEKRPFSLHATIGRPNKNALITPIEEEIRWRMQVRSFALIQSQLLSTGAEYEVLATFPLL